MIAGTYISQNLLLISSYSSSAAARKSGLGLRGVAIVGAVWRAALSSLVLILIACGTSVFCKQGTLVQAPLHRSIETR